MNQHNPSSTPASLAEISTSLQVLFDALPFQRGAKTDNVAAAYLEALRGCTAQAVSAGVLKFLRGECSDVSPRFVPTPPELSRIVRAVIIPQRVPTERRVTWTPERVVPGERERMRLKMQMWRFAFANGRMDDLDRASREGFGSMVVLAAQWGIEIPAELLALPEREAEEQWRRARRQAWADIERTPPPFMRNSRSAVA